MADTEKMPYEMSTRIDKEKFKILVCTIKSKDGSLNPLEYKTALGFADET